MERKHELSEVARSRSGSWNDLSQSSTSATSKRCIRIRWRPLTPYFVCTVDSVGKVYLQTATEYHLPDGWVRLYPTKLPVDAVHAMRNLSTTLRHRRFLFTDSFLLLWKWRVG